MTQEHRVNIGFRYFQDVFTYVAFGLVKTSGLLIQFKIFDNCKDVISAQDNLTLVCIIFNSSLSQRSVIWPCRFFSVDVAFLLSAFPFVSLWEVQFTARTLFLSILAITI